jgi:hypothetical protein
LTTIKITPRRKLPYSSGTLLVTHILANGEHWVQALSQLIERYKQAIQLPAYVNEMPKLYFFQNVRKITGFGDAAHCLLCQSYRSQEPLSCAMCPYIILDVLNDKSALATTIQTRDDTIGFCVAHAHSRETYNRLALELERERSAVAVKCALKKRIAFIKSVIKAIEQILHTKGE